MVNFEDGTLVTPAHVNEDGTITPAVYSGNTPLSAYNLNNMQDVVVSATEPTGISRKKVWIQKGKNLFNGIIINDYGLNDDGTIYGSSKRAVTEYINIVENTNYCFSGATFAMICIYDKNKNFISSFNGTTTSTFLTTNNTCYVRLAFDITTDYSNLQLEQGTVATDYEEYKDKKIYIKNNDNVYEEFVNIEKNVLTAGLISNTTITSTDKQNLKLHGVFKLGNGFSINSDGNIVIDKDLNAVKISANCIYVPKETGVKSVEIYFNNIQKAVSYKISTTSITDTIVIPSALITNVKKGDIIYFKYKGSIGDIVGGQSINSAATYLTVESI